MRWRAFAALALALAAIATAGCRQVLGIPGDFETPGIRVGGTITGAIGANPASIYLAIDGVQVDSVAVTADGDLDLFTDNPGEFAVTADLPCTVARGTGTLTDAGVEDVAVSCDGLSTLRTLGISAPVGLIDPFAPQVVGYTLDFSILTQEVTLRPDTNYPGASVDEVRIGTSVIDRVDDHYGPFALDDASELAVEVRHAGVTDHAYVATTGLTPPAEFGYGKAGDSAAAAWFGSAVAADADLVVVGAPERDGQTGEVFVYRRTDQRWVEDAHLVASDAAAGAKFGASVAVAGDVIAIGAPGASGGAGAAYFYRHDGTSWVEARVTGATAAAGDAFGTAVAVASGPDLAVVGAPGDDIGGTDAGAAYVFEWSGSWNRRPALMPVADAGAGFGSSVATNGEVVVVGAPTEDGASLVEPGAVYVFDGPPWSTAEPLVPTDRDPGDHFGAAVAIGADGTIAVGAPQADPGGILTGQAYLFRAGTHEETDVIVPATASAGDGVGAAISIAGRVVAIGAPREDSSAPGTPDELASAAGAVFVYPINASGVAGTEHYFKASNIGADDQFGAAIALTIDTLVAGAPFEDSGTDGWSTSSIGANNGQDEAGAVYAFR